MILLYLEIQRIFQFYFLTFKKYILFYISLWLSVIVFKIKKIFIFFKVWFAIEYIRPSRRPFSK